ncbi:hypothetical protein PXK56_18045 [Phaeobacter gallaeciensis]|uniref:hypothetical protein n=1 Tax=Phaeobacter gallaeciensis TaxID=60890 RepID=UPI00238041B9|nr:hypothetical protein [Phaeobacter gallaeciensis]MDE4297092.1 hypothetical protein [Phaeobacter gallaeciensis]
MSDKIHSNVTQQGFDKQHLKITQKGFESYNGPLSVYEFVDGVSVEPIPRHDRDRIAATMQCIEIAENGKEVIAGVAERLVTESADRAPKKEVFKTQSPEDKVAEEVTIAEKTIGEAKKVYTEDELDEIIKDGGIAALRRVAETWNVKNRSIPTLRQMVLDAQDEYVAQHGKKLGQIKEAVAKVAQNTAKANDVPEKTIEQEVEDDEILTAAATGDLSAAVSESQNENATSGSTEKAE